MLNVGNGLGYQFQGPEYISKSGNPSKNCQKNNGKLEDVLTGGDDIINCV